MEKRRGHLKETVREDQMDWKRERGMEHVMEKGRGRLKETERESVKGKQTETRTEFVKACRTGALKG